MPDITITLTSEEAAWLQTLLIGIEGNDRAHMWVLLKLVEARASTRHGGRQQSFGDAAWRGWK